HGNGHALAGGKAICLYDDWSALFLRIGLGIVRIAETLVCPCWNAMTAAQVFRKPLGAFELCSSRRWTEGIDAAFSQCIRKACNKRRFRADHDKVNAVVATKAADCVMIIDVQRDNLRML